MFKFGQHIIQQSCVFWESRLCFAFVNIRPVLPGHVLVSPKRLESHFTGLSLEESADLFAGAQLISKALKSHYCTDSLTLVVQDGKYAGQSVAHVHVHLIPRTKGDFVNNDDIYGEIERVDVRKTEVRSIEDMQVEASVYRKLISSLC